MKKLLYIIVVLLLSLSSFAQTPNAFNYQAIVRDVSGGILANKKVSIKLEIIKGKTTETVVYTEIWDVQTSLLGLVNVEVGAGDPVSFAKIDWSTGPFSLAVSVDGELLGKSPMLSVPFAMQAQTLVNNPDPDPTNELQNLSLVGDQLSISKGNTITIPAGKSNQTLSLSGTQLSISNGNAITLPADKDNQTLKLTGNSLSIDGGNAVDLSPYTYDSDNQSLYISGNTLSIGGGNSVMLPTGMGSGDMVKATYDANANNKVDVAENTEKLQGVTVTATGPTANQVLTYNGTAWAPATPAVTSADATSAVKGIVQLAGDLAGTAALPTVPGLATKVNTTTTINGQALSANITLVKADVGLANVDNTTDLLKPVSTATQAGLDLKANIADLGTAAAKNTGTAANNVVQLDGSSKLPAVDGSQLTNLPAAPVTSVAGLTGVVVLSKTDVGLANVDNTTDLLKPVSTATQAGLALKANIADLGTAAAKNVGTDANNVVQLDGSSKLPAVDGSQLINLPAAPVTSVAGLTGVVVLSKTDVGLANVDNTTDLLKPVSTATQAGLDLKENTANKSTSTTLGTSDVLFPTQKAVKTYVDAAITGATIADADATTKGKIQLAGDLGGTAALPAVAANAITTTKIANSAVTYAKIQDVTAAKLLGRNDATTGAPEEITVGTGLALTGTTLMATTVAHNITILSAALTTYSVVASDYYIINNNASGSVTITLPLASTCLGRELVVYDNSGLTTVDFAGAVTGGNVTAQAGIGVHLLSIGTAWICTSGF